MSKLYLAYLVIPLCIVSLFCSTAQAQNVTFYENFDNTKIGELPTGWTYYQSGGSNPDSHWMVSTKDMFGSKLAWSNWGDDALAGDIDEDWLITPKITPKNGDFLIFDASQVFVDTVFGSKYHVLLSTKSNAPGDFTDTLASYTEEEFPGYEETLFLDLKGYYNKPIYIAFVHENSSADWHNVDDWYLDNVWVRPKQQADFYQHEIYSQTTDVLPLKYVGTGVIVGIKLTIVGDYDLANLTSLTFAKIGTIDPAQITSASLYSTGQDSFISTIDEENSIQGELFGTVATPDSIFEIKGNKQLPVGDNYFWLFYKINPAYAPNYPYEDASVVFTKVEVNGQQHVLTPPEKTVARPIVESSPANDSIQHAIELLPVGGRYGSYNTRAQPEPAFESLAYCAPEGYFDVSNSIWWYFKAPSDGYMTVDLSETDFNTILLILDKNFDQFACNDNISQEQLQSKIVGYEVKAGQEFYIRVTGAGTPNDPNGPSGIVVLDFNFTNAPLGTDDSHYNWGTLSAPYPNPSHGKTYIDFDVKQPSKISFEVVNLVGASVWTSKENTYAPGVKHIVPIDTSDLPAGTYILHIKGDSIHASRKLIITR
ncbi:choice-of-anchor J domain-containing protein [Cytophagaceae bacterium YF14B1]|uniref:Choice-of-anchor J domain-containing protein n=1 Tax=Xanthocytophaga flava TaxID=3048013 RepID=A0AAE3QYV7_9BACT|nr:choice-of-anchor J domain-containing protein [Xanthocytophaga flavus]MDJ1486035.1 choice-of-anchor J domain-containing protein [Xanthocytophaga flavus]